MEIKIYKNINECHRLWEKFTPNKSLFDVWGFRHCFYNKGDNKPYFITGRERGRIVGVVPLCYVESKNQYAYFGGWFPERNSFFLKDKAMMSQLLQECPNNTFVEGISPEEGKYYSFLEDECTYYLDLSKYDNDFEKYFNSFSGKKRKNLRRDLKKIPKYKVYINRLRDFNRMIELNIKQFDEDSIYNNMTTRNSIYKMISLANKKGILQMISVEVNGKTEAIDVGVLFGDWYHVVTGSSNNEKIPNLGKLLTVLSIKNAIEKKYRFIDFLASSAYWKNQWNFDREMLLKFEK